MTSTPSEGDGRERGGASSLDAALRLLQTMGRMPGPVGLSDLARACGMPASKAHRYLASFQRAGLVRQAGRSGKYDLGAAAIELGLAALGRHDFVNSVADALPDLTEETGLTALLCVWGNSGPTVVRWQRSSTFIVTALGLGTTLPLLTSATGQVCLAFLPDRLTETLLEEESRRPQAGLPRPGKAARMAARSSAREVRNAGYATVDGRFIPGLVALAAPVLDWQDEAQAIVTLIGTDNRHIAPGSPSIPALMRFAACHAIARPARDGT